MTSVNIPAPAHGLGAGGPGLAQDTGKDSVTNFSTRLLTSGVRRVMCFVSSYKTLTLDTAVILCFKIYPILILADVQRAGLDGGPIRGVEGGPRAHEGGGPTPGIEAAAVDQGQHL